MFSQCLWRNGESFNLNEVYWDHKIRILTDYQKNTWLGDLINEKVFSKATHFGKVTLIDAPLSYNIGNGSKESDKYNKCHCHLAYEIRDVKGTKQLICTGTYLVAYLLKNIRQYEKIDMLFNVGCKVS